MLLNPLQICFKIGQEVQELEKYQPDIKQHPGLMKGHLPFLGELLLGHLRYGTQGKNNVEFCHPFIKRDLMPGKNLALAGNFNLVNTDELFEQIGVNPGDFQKQSDLAAMMEVVHHYLVNEDEANPNNANITNVLKMLLPYLMVGILLEVYWVMVIALSCVMRMELDLPIIILMMK